MNSQVLIVLPHDDDESVSQELVNFFSPIANVNIERRPAAATKAVDTVISLVHTIVEQWAAERYILNPVAQRIEDWLKTILFTWEKSKSKRSFQVLIKFQDNRGDFEVELFETMDLDAIHHLWEYVKRAADTKIVADKKGVKLDKIRILADGKSKNLVIGYVGNRPEYTLNLAEKTFDEIKHKVSTQEIGDLEGEIWYLEERIRQLNYFQMLRERGYPVTDEKMTQLANDIEVEKSKLGKH